MDYRSQLKAFKKLQFDPFRRRDRIIFHYNDNDCLHTTIGQLNFFRWAIENDIIEQIKTDFTNIENDMLTSQKTTKNLNKKRHELSKSSIKNMTKYHGNVLINFN
jgi:CRISPR/Cas system CMR-associated protein Cmr1 (group 7 of RAMP superfamily)